MAIDISERRQHERDLERQRDELEWVWPTDGEILAAEALDPANIQETGAVSYEAVADELRIPFDPEEHRD